MTHRLHNPSRLGPRRRGFRRAGPQSITRAILGFGVALALFAPSALSQAVSVVAPVPGHGVNFTDIQPAVDAAQDGDVIRVRPGHYNRFTISAKSLTVAGDGRGVFYGGASIDNLGAAQSVVLRNANSAGISLQNCVGPVTIEAVASRLVRAGAGAGAGVSSCAAVTFIDCHLTGTSRPYYGSYPGLSSVSSNILRGLLL